MLRVCSGIPEQALKSEFMGESECREVKAYRLLPNCRSKRSQIFTSRFQNLLTRGEVFLDFLFGKIL